MGGLSPRTGLSDLPSGAHRKHPKLPILNQFVPVSVKALAIGKDLVTEASGLLGIVVKEDDLVLPPDPF